MTKVILSMMSACLVVPLINLLALTPAEIIHKYLENTLLAKDMEVAKNSILENTPGNMPNLTRSMCKEFQENIFDPIAYEKALQSEKVPPKFLRAIASINAMYETPFGQNIKSCNTLYLSKANNLVATKKNSDFSENRINYFKQQYFRTRGPEKQKRIAQDVTPLMGEVLWRLSTKPSLPSVKNFKEKTAAFVKKAIAEIDLMAAQGEMPKDMLLRKLLRTMAMSDNEFDEYRAKLTSPGSNEMDEYLFDFQHKFIIKQAKKFMNKI